MSLPPGPDSLPAIQMLRWIRKPFELLEECHARYGDVFTLRFPGFPGALVTVSDPLVIKELFGLGPDAAHAGEANVMLEPFVGKRSLLLLDGADHLRQRKMMLPAFHGERMQAYGRAMMDLTHDSIDAWPVGHPFPVHKRTQAITLQVIVRTVFGVEEGPRFTELAEVLTRALDVSAWPPLLFPFMQHDLGPLSPWGRWLRLKQRMGALLTAEIRHARANGVAGRNDVLAMLIQARDERGRPLTEEEVHDELVTLLVAGHETTATSLAWALRWILPDRDLTERLLAEIATAGDDPAKVARLELLDATARETLRLQPVIPMVGRVLQEPRRVRDWELPRGILVAPSIYLVHRRPSLYPEPDRFHPERFRTFRPAAWEFLPFGGGLRKCVGATFAIYEMKMVLAAMLPRVSMRLASDDVHVSRRSITLTPSGGLPIVVRRKRPRPGVANAA